jgi:hypothetical protein
MSFTVESKSQLAKLLATENLQVVHEQIQTACFNLETRTLHCPIWKDMSGELYDLLMGHEVGHALYTPKQGWHDQVCDEGANFKGFLNVIEDSRIEKKIKRKYPGIKRSFLKAYSELMEKDFFKIAGRNFEEMAFIDQINFATKLGLEFDFNAIEKELYDEILSCETWDDVVVVSKKIYEYSKQEQKEKQQLEQESFSYSDSDGDSFDEYEQSDESELSGDEQEQSPDIDEETDESLEDSYLDASGEYEQNEDFEPVCETDENFRRNEVQLLDEQSKEYLYIHLPKPIYKNILTPHSIVHKHLSDYYSQKTCSTLLSKFKEKNDKFISLMAKEFEMRKSAKVFSKVKVSETGDIDNNKIYKYLVEDNIFKKVTSTPKGKSHGLILLLDRSGSMANHMGSSIEQILVLTSFCRKVNIPFVVYGFGSSDKSRFYDFEETAGECFEYPQNVRVLDFSRLYLREYLNSNMKKSEFNNAFKNMLQLAYQYKYVGGHRIPLNEILASTPLNQAMVAIAPLAKKFKKNNNLDIINTVIVNDGDSDLLRNTYVLSEGKKVHYKSVRSAHHNIFIVDRENRIQMKVDTELDFILDSDEGFKTSIFEWYKQVTGSKIFGFFIVGSRASEIKKNINFRYMEDPKDHARLTYDELQQLYQQIKENKFLESKNGGYNSFYFIPGGKTLEIEDDEIVIKGNVTSHKLVTAFKKMSKNKHTNRVLVSKFISGIS